MHFRAVNETVFIETNPCATEHDTLVTIAITSGVRNLLLIISCAKHTDCPSAMCIPILDMVKNFREERGLRTLFLLDLSHNGVCTPL